MKLRATLAASAAMVTCMTAAPASAGVDAYIGEVTPVAFNFCPRSTAPMDGSLLAISSNTALFSLIGTIYGGDGRTTFALPDLRGRVPMHQGTGPGLSFRQLGQRSGSETNTLNVTQLPSHNHSLQINNNSPADSGNPTGNRFARSSTSIYQNTAAVTATMASDTVGNTGGSQAVNNMQPYLVIKYCIATQGIFPPRS